MPLDMQVEPNKIWIVVEWGRGASSFNNDFIRVLFLYHCRSSLPHCMRFPQKIKRFFTRNTVLFYIMATIYDSWHQKEDCKPLSSIGGMLSCLSVHGNTSNLYLHRDVLIWNKTLQLSSTWFPITKVIKSQCQCFSIYIRVVLVMIQILPILHRKSFHKTLLKNYRRWLELRFKAPKLENKLVWKTNEEWWKNVTWFT